MNSEVRMRFGECSSGKENGEKAVGNYLGNRSRKCILHGGKKNWIENESLEVQKEGEREPRGDFFSFPSLFVAEECHKGVDGAREGSDGGLVNMEDDEAGEEGGGEGATVRGAAEERRPSTTRSTLASSSRERWRRRERVRWWRSIAEMCWRQVRRAGTRAPT